jgi:hypothetical protein
MSVSRRAPLLAALSLALPLATTGCKSKEPAGPPPSGLPPLAADPAAGMPADHPTHPPTATGAQGMPLGMANDPGVNPHAGGMPPGHPAVGEGAGMDEQATPGDIPFDPKAVVKGVLRLDDKVKAKVAEGDVIFLVARGADAAGAPGPVLAVKKLNAGKWPLSFTLDARDAMVSGTKLHGKVVITARVDKDGDAISKNPGDVTGASRPVEVPADKVVITLDTVL